MKKRMKPKHPLAGFMQTNKNNPFFNPPPLFNFKQKPRKTTTIKKTIPLFKPSPLFNASPLFNVNKHKKNPRFPMLGDRDKDGVMNIIDCMPNNPHAQDWPGEPERHSEVQLKAEMRRDGWSVSGDIHNGQTEITKVMKESKDKDGYINIDSVVIAVYYCEEDDAFDVRPIREKRVIYRGTIVDDYSKIMDPNWKSFKDPTAAMQYALEISRLYSFKNMVGGL